MERHPVSAALPATLALLLAAPLVLGVLVPGALHAQSLELGLAAGLNRSTVAWSPTPLGDGFETLEHRTSFTGGLTLGLALSDRVVLRAELLRTGKGFREVQANGDDTAIDLAYLELPALLGVRFPLGGSVEPEVYAGPYVARELSCDVAAGVAGQEVEFDCDEIPGDEVLRRTTEWGGVAGVALRVGNAARPRLVFDLRYSYGLRNVDAGPEVDNFDTRHRGLAAMAGVTVPLGL